MKIFFLIALFTFSFIFVKNLSAQNEFHSPPNVKLFADYLFCEKDYLRAAEEYQKLNSEKMDDTVDYKIALSYSIIKDFANAKKSLSKIGRKSVFYELSALELLKINYLLNEKTELEKSENFDSIFTDSQKKSSAMKLIFLAELKEGTFLKNANDFLFAFNDSEKASAKELFDLKIFPPYKNSLKAGILSAIIPGAGKFYVDEIGDGVMALLTTGIFAFLSYDNFKAEHNFRGWLFAGISTLFYAGNIYGSVAAAQIYNTRVDYEFGVKLNSFLDDNKFFIPQINFCK